MPICSIHHGEHRHITYLWRKFQRDFLEGSAILRGNDKNGDFKHGRMFGRVAKIPIADTFSELVEMDFADYGDFAALLRIQGAFSRFSVIAFIGAKRQEGQTSEMVR